MILGLKTEDTLNYSKLATELLVNKKMFIEIHREISLVNNFKNLALQICFILFHCAILFFLNKIYFLSKRKLLKEAMRSIC